MRYDIFTKPLDWKLHVQAVTMANTKNIIRALEAQGEHVGAFYHPAAIIDKGSRARFTLAIIDDAAQRRGRAKGA